MIAGPRGIVPFGGELAHKGFALALLVELLATALAPVDGDAALRAAGAAGARQPAAGAARGAAGPAVPGRRRPRGAGRRRERAGAVDLDDDLWRWLSSG